MYLPKQSNLFLDRYLKLDKQKRSNVLRRFTEYYLSYIVQVYVHTNFQIIITIWKNFQQMLVWRNLFQRCQVSTTIVPSSLLPLHRLKGTCQFCHQPPWRPVLMQAFWGHYFLCVLTHFAIRFGLIRSMWSLQLSYPSDDDVLHSQLSCHAMWFLLLFLGFSSPLFSFSFW